MAKLRLPTRHTGDPNCVLSSVSGNARQILQRRSRSLSAFGAFKRSISAGLHFLRGCGNGRRLRHFRDEFRRRAVHVRHVHELDHAFPGKAAVELDADPARRPDVLRLEDVLRRGGDEPRLLHRGRVEPQGDVPVAVVVEREHREHLALARTFPGAIVRRPVRLEFLGAGNARQSSRTAFGMVLSP